METLPTSTSTFLIGVVKDKLTAKFSGLKLHLRSNKCHYSFAIDYHFNSCFLDHLIKFFNLLISYIVHTIGKTLTAFLRETDFDSYLYKNIITSCLSWLSDMICLSLWTAELSWIDEEDTILMKGYLSAVFAKE